MTPKLKQLNETVGALNKEIRSYLDSEKRKALTAEQRASDAHLTELENKFAAASADFQAEFRQAGRESGKPIELTKGEEHDVSRFDLGVALRSLVDGTKLQGIEAEMVAEGRKEARTANIGAGNGLVLPRMLVRRGGFEQRAGNALSATGTTSTTLDQGGMTIATNKAGLLDDFYNASILRQNGATVLEGLQGNLDIPRLLQATNPAKKAENAPADAANATTSMLSLKPKRLPAYVDIGEQLLNQSSSAIETIIRRNITAQLLAIQEIAFFHGGGTNEANGIAGTSGIGSVVGGTNGLAPTWTQIVGLESKVDVANALLGTPKYFFNGKTKAQLKTTLKNAATGTDSTYILNDMNVGIVNGYEYKYTNAISSTLTKGSASGICSALFFGNPADYWIGYWGGLVLELLRDSSNAITGQYRLAAAAYYDGGVVRAQSFSAMLDALTPNA
jgi:HK97 family phage major capsid protein